MTRERLHLRELSGLCRAVVDAFRRPKRNEIIVTVAIPVRPMPPFTEPLDDPGDDE